MKVIKEIVKSRRVFHLDLLMFVKLPLAIWLGVTGTVSWWVILLIFLMTCKLEFTWKAPWTLEGD